MRFDIVTLFPDYFAVALKQSLLGKAIDKGLFEINIVNLRDYAEDKHKTVDDSPYGGGGGMIMKVDVLDSSLEALGWKGREDEKPVRDKQVLLLTSAAGRPFDQDTAIRYSLLDRLTIVCGHYMGVDERIMQLHNFEEVSIGDYVLTGGEPAAAVIVDATARLIPKVLGNFESALEDSYMNQLLGAPCYTRPAEYRGLRVPQVLLSGNHAGIKSFRQAEAVKKCRENRPDLLQRADLSHDENRVADRNDNNEQYD